jgi:uncharacterized membrane protein
MSNDVSGNDPRKALLYTNNLMLSSLLITCAFDLRSSHSHAMRYIKGGFAVGVIVCMVSLFLLLLFRHCNRKSIDNENKKQVSDPTSSIVNLVFILFMLAGAVLVLGSVAHLIPSDHKNVINFAHLKGVPDSWVPFCFIAALSALMWLHFQKKNKVKIHRMTVGLSVICATGLLFYTLDSGSFYWSGAMIWFAGVSAASLSLYRLLKDSVCATGDDEESFSYDCRILLAIFGTMILLPGVGAGLGAFYGVHANPARDRYIGAWVDNLSIRQRGALWGAIFGSLVWAAVSLSVTLLVIRVLSAEEVGRDNNHYDLNNLLD